MEAQYVATFTGRRTTHGIRPGWSCGNIGAALTRCGRSGPFAVEHRSSGAGIEVTCKVCAPVDEPFRWIMYMRDGMGMGGAFELTRVTSLHAARSEFESFADGPCGYKEGTSATLYAYSAEAWESAKEFEYVGCPFDCPDKISERGPRGGIRFVNA